MWLGHYFQDQKVKGQGHQATLLSAALTCKAAEAVSMGTFVFDVGKYCNVASARRRATGEERGGGNGHIVSPRAQFVTTTSSFCSAGIFFQGRLQVRPSPPKCSQRRTLLVHDFFTGRWPSCRPANTDIVYKLYVLYNYKYIWSHGDGGGDGDDVVSPGLASDWRGIAQRGRRGEAGRRGESCNV